MPTQSISPSPATPSAEPRMAFVVEPTNRRQPALGRHLGLDLPALFGVVLQPRPERALRAVFGVKMTTSAKIMTPAQAADQLAELIADETLICFGPKYERTIAWLRIAAKLTAEDAPLLFEAGVRAALMAAIANARPEEIANAA